MTLIRIALVLALALVTAGAVEAAPVTIRTAPVFNLASNAGEVACAAVNGGTGTFDVTVTLFGTGDNALMSNTLSLGPNVSKVGTLVPVLTQDPTSCECVVPNKQAFRCSFVYVNGEHATVVPAE